MLKDWQGKGCAWTYGQNKGIIYIPIFKKDEKNPDIFVSVKNDAPNKIFLDRSTFSYAQAGNHAAVNELPEKWESRDFKDVKNESGIKKSFSGDTIGSLQEPWEFNYFPPSVVKLKEIKVDDNGVVTLHFEGSIIQPQCLEERSMLIACIDQLEQHARLL